MNKILRCDHLIFIFLLLAGMNAFANNLNEQPDTLEAKSRLEQIVTKKIQDRISTQLPKDTFNVGVQVTFEAFFLISLLISNLIFRIKDLLKLSHILYSCLLFIGLFYP